MKILLVNPPNRNMITTNVPSVVDEETGFYPPLGLMYVASYLKEHSPHSVHILDAQVEKVNYKQLKEKISRINPDIVGIQATTFTLIDSMLTAKIVKELNKNIKVVLGGPHVNIFPDETISIKDVDYLVLGEGERTFTELIKHIDNKARLNSINNLVFEHNNRVIHTKKGNLIEDLDFLPFPARELTPYKKYHSLLAKKSPITTMMTSRGCPYKCLFCDRPHLGKKFRYRAAENVVDEMEHCIQLGIKEIFLYDDTFTINRQRVLDICSEIKARKLDIAWDIRARVNTVDYEILKALKKAGCERIHYGVEAGNPEILKILRKGITLEQAKKAFKMTRKLGIQTLAYFMLGNPGEGKKEILESIKLSKQLKPDFVHFSITTPFPSTGLYRLGLEKGILSHDYWKEFAKSPSRDFQPELWEEKLTREELIQLLRYAYKKFYMRPTYITKSLFKINSFEEFKKKAKAGLRLFGM